MLGMLLYNVITRKLLEDEMLTRTKTPFLETFSIFFLFQSQSLRKASQNPADICMGNRKNELIHSSGAYPSEK